MMKLQEIQFPRHLGGTFIAAAFLLAAPVAQAGMIIAAQSVADAAGTTGATLEVTLTNTGGSAVTVAGFSFGIDVATANLTFTAVDTSTTLPYVFGANSLFGPNISVQPPNLPGQTLEAEDLDSVSGASVAAGASVGLGNVHFNLSAGTPAGPIAVSFISADDSLFDPNDSAIAFTTTNGAVTVPSSAPEPASCGLAGIALMALAGCRIRRSAGKSR